MDPDELARQEEEAAAAEAGEIGGKSGMEGMSEAERAAAEAGGGESEGFEQSEQLLREHAERTVEGGDPLRDRPDPEPERSGAEYGDADDLESTETDVDTQGTPGDLDGSGEGGVPDTQT